jgi:hypothetical protein
MIDMASPPLSAFAANGNPEKHYPNAENEADKKYWDNFVF